MTLAPWREGSFEIATQDGQCIVNPAIEAALRRFVKPVARRAARKLA